MQRAPAAASLSPAASHTHAPAAQLLGRAPGQHDLRQGTSCPGAQLPTSHWPPGERPSLAPGPPPAGAPAAVGPHSLHRRPRLARLWSCLTQGKVAEGQGAAELAAPALPLH
eukprot:1159864-Pelagomonas_calceolata.AAC.13